MALDAKAGREDCPPYTAVPASDCAPLRDCLRMRLERYFADIDGAAASGQLHRLVMAEIEAPLLQMTLDYTRGNLSRAAAVLGINRATLRRKLREYRLAE